MSDNVSKFDPNPRRTIRRRIAAFVLAVLLVGGGITLYVFRDSLNLDAVRRFVRYLNVKTDETGGSFTFDSHNANQYADLQGGLAVASVSGLSLYDASGSDASIRVVSRAPSAVGFAPSSIRRSQKYRASSELQYSS